MSSTVSIDALVSYTVSFFREPISPKRVQRLLDRIVRNRTNCAFADLQRLLLAVGFVERHARGSHRIFKLGGVALSVPQRSPLKEHYVDEALAILQQLGISTAPTEGRIVSRRVVYEPRPGEVGVQSVITAESLAV